MGAVIVGTGVARPPNVLGNDDLARIMDTSDEWIRSRTGVVERAFVDEGTGSSDLAIVAGRAALGDAGLDPGNVDLLVTATMTPDRQNPGIVAPVQHGLDMPTRVTGIDLRAQCSGFLTGLDIADAHLGSRRAEIALVVGAEVHSGYMPWGDTWDIALGRSNRRPTDDEWERNTATRGWSVLFGDGAGAMVLRRGTDDEGILATALFTDGAHSELIAVEGLGFRHRPYVDHGQIDAGLHVPVMDGTGLYRQAVARMPEAIEAVLGRVALSIADIDLVVAHQANDRITAGVARRLGLPADAVPSNIARWGNTTAGTLPILYHELKSAGRVQAGHLVCFVAFGAGAHWGAILYRVPDA